MICTLLDFVIKGESLLREAGIKTAQLDSELLLAHALNVDRTRILTHANDTVSEKAAELFESLLNRRSNREPLAYITGEKEFYSLAFKVTPALLIPRPETETIVDAAFDVYGTQTSISVIDIGAGSGAIAVALAKHRPMWRVVAVDSSEAALEMAKENIIAHSLDARISLKVSDFFSAVEGTKFDLVISNPPYIPEGSPLEPELGFEPDEALFSGADGFNAITRLVNESADYISDGGKLIFEVGDGQAAKAMRMVNDCGYYGLTHAVKDLHGIERVIVAEKTYG